VGRIRKGTPEPPGVPFVVAAPTTHLLTYPPTYLAAPQHHHSPHRAGNRHVTGWHEHALVAAQRHDGDVAEYGGGGEEEQGPGQRDDAKE
jgi:hypothetical protein